MDLTADLAELRAQRQESMTDTCRTTRPGSVAAGDRDPDTGLHPAPDVEVVYTGPCSVRVPGTVSASRSRESAGDEAVLLTAILSVPVDAAPHRIGDTVEFTGSTFAAHLVGQKWSVDGLIPGSRRTAQRVSITVVVD